MNWDFREIESQLNREKYVKILKLRLCQLYWILLFSRNIVSISGDKAYILFEVNINATTISNTHL